MIWALPASDFYSSAGSVIPQVTRKQIHPKPNELSRVVGRVVCYYGPCMQYHGALTRSSAAASGNLNPHEYLADLLARLPSIKIT